MIPLNKVRELISKHSLLEKELSSGNVDKKKFAEKSKEYSDLNEIIKENDLNDLKLSIKNFLKLKGFCKLLKIN